jgi:flagellar hook-associated protein 2
MAGIQGSIQGINSQLDTEQLIEALLTFEKRTITRFQEDQALKTNQISTYQAINTRLLAFQTQASILSKAEIYTATKINVSDEDFLTAAAGSNVALGSYSLNITALAQNHQIASQGFSEQEIKNLGTGSVTIAVGDGSAKSTHVGCRENRTKE